MFANGLDISVKQCCNLLTFQPHRLLLHPHLQADAAVGLVEDDNIWRCLGLADCNFGRFYS